MVSANGDWLHWSEMVLEFVYPSDQVLPYYEILVPNIDNTRTQFLIDTIAKQGKAVLLIGIDSATLKYTSICKFYSLLFIYTHLCLFYLMFKSQENRVLQRL